MSLTLKKNILMNNKTGQIKEFIFPELYVLFLFKDLYVVNWSFFF